MPKKRFLALGDSYTIGVSVAESQWWPNQLVARLRADGVDIGEPRFIAKNGWTTGHLLEALDAEKPESAFDAVSLLIGVNNQYDGLDEGEFAEELETLIELACGYTNGVSARVVVVSIPDWSVTPFAADRDRAAIRKAIDQYNRLKLDTARRLGCPFVDVTTISRRATEDRSLLADDGLHPAGSMYAAWCEELLPVFRKALAAGPK